MASDQSMNTNEYQGDNQDNDFSFEVHLLASKLVPVVVIHSLGGSRAGERFNRVPHNQHKMRIT